MISWSALKNFPSEWAWRPFQYPDRPAVGLVPAAERHVRAICDYVQRHAARGAYPLIILWLGIGTQSKIAAVFLGAFFPLVINVMAGVKTVDETLLKCARSFGANDWQVFRTLALPSCVPFLVAGIVWLGARTGRRGRRRELASTAGVGHMMTLASDTFQMDKMFVGLILLAGFGYILTVVLISLEKHFEFWRP